MLKTELNRSKSLVFVALTQLIWPTNAAVPILLLSKFDSTQLIFLNSIAGFLIIFLILLFQRKLGLTLSFLSKPEKLLQMFVMGLLGIVLYLTFLYRSYVLIPAQIAYSVNLLWPVMTVILSVMIIKEHIQKKQILGISIAFMGVLVIVSKGNFTISNNLNWFGVIFALLASVSYGTYSVLGKKWDQPREISMFYYYLFSMFTTGIYLLLGHQSIPFPQIELIDIIGFIWVGGFILAMGDLFWFLALRYGNTAELSTITLFSPFLGYVWIYLLLEEVISIYSVIGMFIVLIGNYFSRYRNDQLITV